MEGSIVEHDVVVSLVETTAHLIAERKTQVVEAGTLGSVVAVYKEGPHTEAYEVEFHLGGNSWGLATLPVGEVDRPSSGRLYHAVVWSKVAESKGLRVAVCAKDLEEANEKLEARYGGGTVFDLRNREDATLPRLPSSSKRADA